MHKINSVMTAALLAAVFTLGPGNTPARAGLRAAWSFEESEGASVYDSSGNHNIGIIRGDPRGVHNLWVARADFERREGRAGKALYLKNRSFVEVPDTDDIRLNGCFTIEGRWLYGTNSTPQVLFYKGFGGYAGYGGYKQHNYAAVIAYGKITFSCADTNGTVHSVSAPAPPAGEWRLLDFVYNGKTLAIYFDKKLAASQETGIVRCMTEFSQGLLLGAKFVDSSPCHILSSVLEGGADEIRIYDEALTPERMGQPLVKKAEVPSLASGRESALGRILRHIGLKKAQLAVTQDGRAAAAIVIRKGYTALQAVPAKELQKYIEKLAGARLPILEDDTGYSGNMILVGESRYTRELGITMDKMPGDSYVVRSFPGRLVLAGHDAVLDVSGLNNELEVPTRQYYVWSFKTVKNGTLNAVYAFLQDYCGVRWFMPGELWEHIPPRRDLKVSGLNITEQPHRGYVIGWPFMYQRWKNRNFIGESAGVFAFDMQHDWSVLVPWRHYGSHPAWFAMQAGRRIDQTGRVQSGHGASLCTSNHEMWETALQNLKLICSQGFDIVNLCQNDGYRRCQCPDCEALDGYRERVGYYVPGNSANRIWIFHDYLAREMQKAYPQCKISMYAYGPTGEIPDRNKIPKLPDNVIIELCQNNTTLDRDLLERWRQYHPAPYGIFFVYWFFAAERESLPHSYDYLANELKTLALSYGGRSFWFTGGLSKWELNAPIYYMLARLLRNPDQDPGAILDEFCAGLFGPAAVPMRDYFRALYSGSQRRVQDELAKYKEQKIKAGDGEPVIGISIPVADKYRITYPDEIISACERHLDQARKSADTGAIKKRIEFFADAFEAQKLTAQGFKLANGSEAAEWSKETLRQLVQAVQRRNQFIEDVDKRRQSAAGEKIFDRYPAFGKGFELFDRLSNMDAANISDDGSHVAVVLDGCGAAGIIGALTGARQKYFPLFTPVANNPARHPALIIAHPRAQIRAYNNGIARLRDYVKNGGAVMLTYDAVGYRGYKAAFPEIGAGKQDVADAGVVVAADHAITSGMKAGGSFKHAYFDHIILEKGPQGTVICADTNGRPVLVAGGFGKGKVILNGMIPGYASVKEGEHAGKEKEPEGAERQLLLNAVNWLEAR